MAILSRVAPSPRSRLRVLTVNAGSSSLKLRLLGSDDELLTDVEIRAEGGAVVPGAAGGAVDGGTVAGSDGATDGVVVGAQSAGIDDGGSETVPVGATVPGRSGAGRIDENASSREAAVRSQLTPSGTWPPE